jgi:hypothetical protein
MSRPSAQQVRELAQFYATEGDAYGHLAEDLAREAQRFEVEEAAFEERVQALAPVIWGELTKHDPNTWPEMSVHSLEGAADVARVVLVWLDAQQPAKVEVWAKWRDVPEGVPFTSRDERDCGTWRREGETVYSNVYGAGPVPTSGLSYVAPFVRADG